MSDKTGGGAVPGSRAGRHDAHTLAEVIGRLGPSLMRVAVAPEGSLSRCLNGVSVNDPLLDLPEGRGEVLLAVGVDALGDSAVDLVQGAAARGFIAIVFHLEGALPEQLSGAARRLRVAVLTAPVDVPWIHLASMLRVGITSPPHDEVAGVPLGDLFGFANSLAARLRGPVTVEDPQSHVLAYSSVSDEVDEPRKETILGRQVPQKYTRVLQERGVIRRLLTSDDVVHMDAMPEVRLSRRVAISVRAAGELLGSIWVAETGQPLAADHGMVLREAAHIAALHIMRHRMELQAESNVRRSMVCDLLDGAGADVAAVRLGLAPEAQYVVVAFEAAGGGTPSNRLLKVIDLYCSTFRRTAVTLDVGPRVYAVLCGDRIEPGAVLRFAADGAGRATSASQVQVHAAVGGPVSSVDRVTESRHDADRVMRVLLRGEPGRTVADLHDVRASANLLEVLDLLRERPHLQEGPLSLLGGEDGERYSALVGTLAAYFDHFGDIPSAAASLQVHPNTFRYRLRRAREVAGLNLDDPKERLMLALQLRLLGQR